MLQGFVPACICAEEMRSLLWNEYRTGITDQGKGANVTHDDHILQAFLEIHRYCAFMKLAILKQPPWCVGFQDWGHRLRNEPAGSIPC